MVDGNSRPLECRCPGLHRTIRWMLDTKNPIVEREIPFSCFTFSDTPDHMISQRLQISRIWKNKIYGSLGDFQRNLVGAGFKDLIFSSPNNWGNESNLRTIIVVKDGFKPWTILKSRTGCGWQICLWNRRHRVTVQYCLLTVSIWGDDINIHIHELQHTNSMLLLSDTCYIFHHISKYLYSQNTRVAHTGFRL